MERSVRRILNPLWERGLAVSQMEGRLLFGQFGGLNLAGEAPRVDFGYPRSQRLREESSLLSRGQGVTEVGTARRFLNGRCLVSPGSKGLNPSGRHT